MPPTISKLETIISRRLLVSETVCRHYHTRSGSGVKAGRQRVVYEYVHNSVCIRLYPSLLFCSDGQPAPIGNVFLTDEPGSRRRKVAFLFFFCMLLLALFLTRLFLTRQGFSNSLSTFVLVRALRTLGSWHVPLRRGSNPQSQ